MFFYIEIKKMGKTFVGSEKKEGRGNNGKQHINLIW